MPGPGAQRSPTLARPFGPCSWRISPGAENSTRGHLAQPTVQAGAAQRGAAGQGSAGSALEAAEAPYVCCMLVSDCPGCAEGSGLWLQSDVVLAKQGLALPECGCLPGKLFGPGARGNCLACSVQLESLWVGA